MAVKVISWQDVLNKVGYVTAVVGASFGSTSYSSNDIVVSLNAGTSGWFGVRFPLTPFFGSDTENLKVNKVTISYEAYGSRTSTIYSKGKVTTGYYGSSGFTSVSSAREVGRGSSNATSISDTIQAEDVVRYSGSIGDYAISTCWYFENPISYLSLDLHIVNLALTIEYEQSYTVSFYGNGATSGSVESQTGDVGENLTLRNNGFSKQYTVNLNQNYPGSANSSLTSSATFIGWEDHGDITSTVDNQPHFTYTQFDAPFYANTYGDLYNAFGYNKLSLVNHYVTNGKDEGRQCIGSPRGTYPEGATVSNLTDAGETCPLYAQWSEMSAVTLPTPTREGYTFLGWYTEAEGGTLINSPYTPTGNVTLYAHWEQASASPVFTSVQMLYGGEQISEANRVIAGEGFLLQIGVE